MKQLTPIAAAGSSAPAGPPLAYLPKAGLIEPKVLIVEDDKDIAELIADTLTPSGFKIYHFGEANSAWEWLKKDHPVDLIIADLFLPGLQGTHFCSLIRNHPTTASLPVLMLSAFGAEAHKVQGLLAGADDYLTKPFSPKELLARLQALLRRSKFEGKGPRLLEACGIQVNVDRAEVRVHGKHVDLAPKEYALLALLMEKRGRVLPYRFIAEALWGYEEPGCFDTIKKWISNLRKKLGPPGEQIRTITCQGYGLW